MANTTTDERASVEDVRANAAEILTAAHEVGVTDVRVQDDGTLVVHADQPGYRQVLALVRRMRDIVGTYVHVITDDVPAATGARPL